MTDKEAKKAATKAKQEAKLAKQLERIKALGDDLDTIWPPSAAALLLDVTMSALAKWRRTGGGPEFTELSKTRVGYRKRALIEFMDRRKRQSTSESSAAAAAASGAAR